MINNIDWHNIDGRCNVDWFHIFVNNDEYEVYLMNMIDIHNIDGNCCADVDWVMYDNFCRFDYIRVRYDEIMWFLKILR